MADRFGDNSPVESVTSPAVTLAAAAPLELIEPRALNEGALAIPDTLRSGGARAPRR